jgi:prepilin-type N-terminal cleavage/methylation domain-containing protein
MLKKNKQLNNIGFTLVELLVVISVIGLLAGLVSANLSGMKEKANIARGKSFSDSIQQKIGVDLVGTWNFNEGSGTTVKDASGMNNNGTFNSAPVWKTGGECISGTCLSFDGVNDYINIPASSSFYYNSGYAFEIWFKPNRVDTTQGPIGQNGGGQYINFWMNNSQLRWETDNGQSFYSNTAIQAGKWYHVVGTYDFSNSLSKLYINGTLDNQGTRTSDKDFTTIPVAIGGYGIGSYLFDGTIDGARIYAQPLTLTQIKSNYLIGLNNLLKNGKIIQEEYWREVVKLNNEYAGAK